MCSFRSIPSTLVVSILLFLSMPFFVQAQLSEYQLTLSPQLPEVGEPATLTITTDMFSLVGGEIRWFIDGVEDTSFSNKKSIVIPSVKSGVTKITTQITKRDGSTVKLQRTIHPIRVDLIVNADSLVPPFYKGRPLPVMGSEVTVTALVFEDTPQPANEYLYIWNVSGEQQNNNITRDNNSVVFSSRFDRRKNISVSILDKKGTLIAKKNTSVFMTDPELYFYEINPLRGLSTIALRDSEFFVAEEMAIQAQPYYIDTNPDGMKIEWKINGKEVTPEGNPLELAIQKVKDTGSVLISFDLSNPKKILQGVEKTLKLEL